MARRVCYRTQQINKPSFSYNPVTRVYSPRTIQRYARKTSRKWISACLVFLLVFQIVAGILLPFNLKINPAGVYLQKSLAAGEAWYNPSWNYRKKITIDRTKVAADQTNFPVLISLDVLSNINANGMDIRFTSSDGTTELPREIESYASGSLRAWVKIPTLSSTADTIIYMYYGNSGATEPAAGSAYGSQNVWKTDGVDTSTAMVQHLPNGTTLSANDSTSNANNGTINGATAATGQIDGAGSFNGTSNYINAGNGASLNITNAITIEAWVKQNTGTLARIVSKRQVGDVSAYILDININTPRFLIGNGTANIAATSAVTINTNAWYHLVGVFNGTTNIVYINGINQGTNNVTTLATNSRSVRIGSDTDGLNPFSGTIDEVRVYNRALSANEITTQYNNQNSPSTFYALGIEEKQSPAALTSWGYRKAITIDHAKVASDQTNFPVLINLPSDANLASHALSTGNDILFTSSSVSWGSGTENDKLAHEIEKYTSATGELVAWVRVPSLSSVTDTVIYMYYGNAAAVDQQNKTVVWDGNAKMVQHMKEDPSGSAPQIIDSTSNANNGTSGGTMTTSDQVSGQIDGSLDFDGVNDYVDLSTKINNFKSLDNGTVEGWIYPTNLGISTYRNIIIGFANSASSNNLLFVDVFGSGAVELLIKNTTVDFLRANSATGIIETNKWYHILYTTNSSGNRLYVNGIQIGLTYTAGTAATNAFFSQATAGTTNPNELNIGYATWNSGSQYSGYFSGIIDEVRVYNRALSANEITTQYNNQNSPSTFYSLGSEEYFDHFTITGTGSMNAGSSQVITLTAKTNLGNTYIGYTGDKSLIFSGANVSGAGNNPTCSDKNGADISFGTAATVTFTNGIATCTLKLYTVESASIHATDGTKTSTGYDLAVTVGSILSSTGIQINSNDAYTVSKDTTLTLSATGASSMKFSNDNITYSTYEAYATFKAWDITNASYGGTSSDGAKTVWVKYKDAYGNEAAAVNDNIVYDTTPPANPASAIDAQGAVTDIWQNNKNAPNFTSFTGASDASGIAGYYVYFGADSTGVSSSYWTASASFTPSSFATSGARYLRAIAKDNAGLYANPGGSCTSINANRPTDPNCWATIFIHKYDIDAPNTPSPASSPANWSNINSFGFSWTNPGDVGGSGVKDYTYRTNAGTSTTTAAPASVGGLTSNAEGTKIFYVKANDNAGNSGTEGLTNFYYDSTPPANAGTVTDGNGSLDDIWGTVSDPSFTWVAGTDAGDQSGVKEYDVYWGTDPAGTTVTAAASTNAYNPAAISANTPYYLRIKTRDNAGNESAWATKFTMKYSQAASTPSALSQTANSATLAFGGSTNNTVPTLNFTLTDPDSDTLGYVIKIDNNSDFSSPEVFYTYSANDLISSAAYSFKVGQAAGTGTYANGSAGQTLSDGQYYWKIKAIESHNLSSSEVTANSGGAAFIINSSAPTNVGISSITADSASQLTVIAQTAADSDPGLAATPYWFNETSGNFGASSSAIWQASTSFVDSGLTPNTRYTYQVKARDGAGNESPYSADSSKYTLANIPSSLIAIANSVSEVTVSWSANSNPAGTQYYAENTAASTNSGWTTFLSWVSSGLSCGTSYSFKVKAKNVDGTETAFTDSVSVSAQNCGGGGLPPVVFNPPAPPSTSSDNIAGNFKVSINNNAAYTNVRDVTLSLDGGPDAKRMAIFNNPDFAGASLELYQLSKVWTLSSGDGTKTVYARFYTQYGQSSPVISANIILDTVPPQVKIANLKDLYYSNEDIILFGFSEPDSKIAPRLDGQHLNFIQAGAFGAFSLSFGKLKAGKHVLELGAKDRAGNIGEIKSFNFTVINSELPVKPASTPLIPLPPKNSPGPPSSSSAYPSPRTSPTAGEPTSTPETKPSISPKPSVTPMPTPTPLSPIEPVSLETKNFIQKFPSLNKSFQDLNIAGLSDPGSLINSSFVIPNLTEVLGLDKANIASNGLESYNAVPVVELDPKLKKEIPSGVIFVKTADEKIDLSATLSFDADKKPVEKLNAVTGQDLNLIIKPERPAESVKGNLVFKSANRQSKAGGGLSLNSILSTLGFKSASAQQTEPKLVLTQFDYSDPEQDGIWMARVQTPQAAGDYEISSVIKYKDSKLAPEEIKTIMVIDPQGYVYEKIGDQELRVKNVTVSIYRLNSLSKEYELWPAKDFSQTNPQITDHSGNYSFLVPPGSYYLKAEAAGYLPYQGQPFEVAEGSGVHMNLEMKRIGDWKDMLTLERMLLTLFGIALAYNFYRDRRRKEGK